MPEDANLNSESSSMPKGVSELDFDPASKLEIKLLKSEIRSLHEEIYKLRNSSSFKLRERLLPQNSFLQRLFLAIRTGTPIRSHTPDAVEFGGWTKRWDTLTSADRSWIREDLNGIAKPPLISVVMPVFNPPERFLLAAIDSMKNQLYPRWELCIADDASTDPNVRATLERYAREDSRIKLHFRTLNGHISAATNDALLLATGSYVGFLDHDDTLADHALYMIVKYLYRFPEAKIIYSDEDKLDAAGKRSRPSFKPDWDPIMALGVNYTSHFSVYDTRIVRTIGGLNEGVEGAQDWDFVLRFCEQIQDEDIVHIPHILYHWRAHDSSTAHDVAVKPYVGAAQVKAVQSALDRRQENGIATRIEDWDIVRISYKIPELVPKVSVIIPTRDRIDILSKCLESLFRLTDYPNYEIVILDNGSVEAKSLEYFDSLKTRSNVKVIRVDAPFNYSALNNRGVQDSDGPILALLNNDVEIIEPDWMRQLVVYASRAQTGAVGSRLLYPSGRIQHAGVVLGFHGIAAHYFLGLGMDKRGYMSRAVVDQSVSAVTAACLFVRREVYLKVGGFDEEFAVAFNDVDFCLKLRAMGLRNIYAGSVTCIHHESLSRGLDDTPERMARASSEVVRLRSRWEAQLSCDPFYNPNLCLSTQTFAIADKPRIEYPWQSAVKS